MPSEFELCSISARDGLPVPPFPLGAIRQAVERPPNRKARGPGRAALAAIAAALSIVAVAAAAEVFGHVQVSVSPSGTAHLYFDGPAGYHGPIRHPKRADFEAAARAVNFPVVFPAGLPPGTRADALTVLGPGAMQIAYALPGAWRRSNHLLFVILANPESVAPDSAPAPHTTYSLEFGQTSGTGAVHRMVGREEMIVLRSTITPAELAHLIAATTARHTSGAAAGR